jgi:hypothetical protein
MGPSFLSQNLPLLILCAMIPLIVFGITIIISYLVTIYRKNSHRENDPKLKKGLPA